MPNVIKPLPFDPAKLTGLSERLLVSHYENNYTGAAKRLNAIRELADSFEPANMLGFMMNGLKREELIAANSAALHELYFASLGGTGGQPEGDLYTQLTQDFGSFEAWHTEFAAMGKALGGGSGWVLLVYSFREGRLFNSWSADHTHVLADAVPLLALDMYEHAYHMDFGAKAAVYVDRFMDNICWKHAQQRFSKIL